MPSDNLSRRASIIVLTLNAQGYLPGLLAAIACLSQPPRRVLFVDSSSTDGTVDLVRAAGHDVHPIARADFGHGKTRNVGAQLCADSEFLVYLTQDARPLGADWLAKLLAPFADERVALVYGRQLPRREAKLSERYAREFNYPDQASRTEWQDLRRAGIKGVFCSNSFAAYRRVALESIGGFPERLPMGEDMAAALRLLQQGYVRVYQPEAHAVHSHAYGVIEELRRYFDIGALLAIDPELRRVSLAASGEGMRLLRGELMVCFKAFRPDRAVGVIARAAAKYMGFSLGQRYAVLPGAWRQRLSMHSYFWSR